MSLLSASSSSSTQPPSPQLEHNNCGEKSKSRNFSSPNNVVTVGSNNSSSPSGSGAMRPSPLILQAPQPSDILFFNENRIDPMVMMGVRAGSAGVAASPLPRPIVKKSASASSMSLSSGGGKRVRFPEDSSIIKDYSEAPKKGWHPGKHSTSDLLDAYIRACDKQKSKPLARLTQQLKALQDLDCANGEKVNVLNLKSERLDSKQVEALEEVFKRLSFKTIDLEATQFEDETTGSTLFEILDYYDTCERLILANVKGLGVYGWQELSKYCRKTISLENLDLRGQTYSEFIYFTYLARSFRLTQSLRTLHLENSGLNSRLLIMLAAAMRDNEQIRELYLGENKLVAATDGPTLASIVKDAKALELFDLRSNTSLADLGLSFLCSALSVDGVRLKSLILLNCGITQSGVPYLCKALIHNQSLTSLNIGHNSLTNESIFELKQALLMNRQMETLCLSKSKLGDEGCVALAEYLAETRTLKRLDLRENDIRLGGLMALASSLKFNTTVERVDLDREPRREQSIRDSIETSKRLIADINEFCARNKREQAERDRIREEQSKLEETIQTEEETSRPVDDLTDIGRESLDSLSTTVTLSEESDENAIDIIAKDDELLKKILQKTFSPQPNLHSPINPDLTNSFLAQFAIDDLNEPADESHSDPDVAAVVDYLLSMVERELEPNSSSLSDSDSDIEVLGTPTSPPNEFHSALPTPEFTPVLTVPNKSRLKNESTPVRADHSPFFDSKLTSSQLSEELSKEIGLFN